MQTQFPMLLERNRTVVLLVLLVSCAVFFLLFPYKNGIVDQVSGITVKARFKRSSPWPADNSSLELQNSIPAAAGDRSASTQQQQLWLELNCSTTVFPNETACSLVDASRYFVCNRRYPRTGAFVAGSSAWDAYGNCRVKPGVQPGACLFERKQQQHQKQNQHSNASAVASTADLNSTASSNRTGMHTVNLAQQLQQQQQHQNQMQYIVVLGDSQGMHYTEALVRGLQAAGANCNMQKQESGADYFGDPAGIAYGQQDCSGCASSLTQCTHSTTQVRYAQ
jgi:hypothetical protein